MEPEGYQSFKASELPQEEQDRLRRVLQFELTEAMIRSIQSNPPRTDLADVVVVLKAGQEDIASSVAACLTCGTCGTCGTCLTS